MGKNILIISSEFPPGPGGIGQHAKSMVVTLAKKHKVIVLCNQDYSNQEEITLHNQMLPTNITIHQFVRSSSKLTAVNRLLQANKIVKVLRPDQIIVTGRFPVWIGGFLKLKYKKLKVEAFAHGTEVSNDGGMLAKITQISLGKLDHVYAVSNFTKTYLINSGYTNVSVVPNGLDSDYFSLLESESTNLNWVGTPRMLTVGNLTNRKGQHRVVKALPKLIERYPELHYHMVGLPTNEKLLSSLAKKLGVSKHITIHGRFPSRKDLVDAYRNSDVFIMLSENQPNGDVEGFGIAILEANAAGKPAIGAKGCGIEDAIGEKSGVLVDGNNDVEIQKALADIMDKYEVYEEGAKHFAKDHNWDKLIEKVVNE